MNNETKYRPVTAITMGDPAGIGPEIVVGAMLDKELHECCKPFVIGSQVIMERAAKVLGKELKYKNVVILIDDISRINFLKFSFGLNSVIICEDTDESLKKLKYLQQINWLKILNISFKENLALSELNFCDYTDHKNLYVSCFYFVDTEKINRISTFMQNNTNKKVDIICPKSIVKYLGSELATCNFHLIDIDKFIEKEINFYE